MATDHELQIVFLEEIFGDVLAEGDAHTAFRRHAAPASLGVAPQHLGHQTLVRRLTVPIHLPDGIQSNIVLREKAPVDHEDLSIDHVAQRQQTERFAEHLVEVRIILLGHFALKPIELVHVPCFVIASRQVQVVRVAQFPCEKREDHLHGKGASIHEVAVEEIWVVLRGDAIDLENVQEIVKLPMYVATNCDLAIFGDLNVDQRLESPEQLNHVEDNRVSELFRDGQFLLVPFHELLAKSRRDFPTCVDGALVRGVYVHCPKIHGLADRLGLFATDGLRKLFPPELVLAFVELLPGISVLWS
mmetsp:Transcript_92004/g.259949  ORF Transcript_92004/g.259949 Transcript_92004/m.259949 type:complete len:302 (-) Transcript_92004:458-1363(-)